MTVWRFEDAQARLGEVLVQADRDGPQQIVRPGSAGAVVLSIAEYRRLTRVTPDLVAHLLGGPKDDEFEVVRTPGGVRDVVL
jgi:prevent-host-death family protein